MLCFVLIAHMAWIISIETELKDIFYEIEILVLLVTMFIGKWLNDFVMYLNGGRMPVFYPSFEIASLKIKAIPAEYEDDETHSVLDKNTKAKILCDVIPTIWIRRNLKLEIAMASIGDLFQFFAIFFYILIFIRYNFF